MKVLLNWVKEFVPFEGSASEAAAVLERLGFEVSSIVRFGADISGVVTAEVRHVEKHPQADRLSLCVVWDGERELSIVCGAPNVRSGICVPLARLGARLPGGHEIKAARIRGVESQGMICSASELGLEDKSEGILILDEGTAPGQDIRLILGLDDSLLELEVTPNRRDALSILGVARELSAGLALPLKFPEPRNRELDMTHPIMVLNEAQDLCPRYTARLIRDIQIGPSPTWMSRRLTRCGIRPINNIVDITNYVLLELGQPLHAFDAVKMKGRRVRIRRAKAGETLLLLDGRTATLQEGMLVIADEARPGALAGIMGGEESAIGPHTQEVILESAAFEPSHIRLNSKALAISSESSYRFERGTDWAMVAMASRRAAQFIQELAGGLVFKAVEASAAPSAPVTIKLWTDKIRQTLGIEMKESLAADYLRRLGCIINTGTGQHAVTVPSWRLDLTREADLLEEIARLHGYDQIPQRTPVFKATAVPEDAGWIFDRKLAGLLAGLGFLETCSTSFLSRAQAEAFVPGLGQPTDARPIGLANPLSQEEAVLRTSLLPGLLRNAQINFNRQCPGVRLFEIGRLFYEDHDGRHEIRRAALLLAGQTAPAHWQAPARPVDFYTLSGALESLLAALHILHAHFAAHRSPALHPRRSCVILAGNTPLGWFGEVHPDLAETFDVPAPLVAELNTAALHEIQPSSITYVPQSVFPPVHRDLSLVVPDRTPYEKLSRTLRAAAGTALEQVVLIDQYQGDKIGAGRKSMTFSLIFRHPEKTLNDAEVEKVIARILSELEKKCEAKLRD